MKKAIFAGLLFPWLLDAQQVQFYPYDFTDHTDKQWQTRGDGEEVRAASQRVATEYLCGVYEIGFVHTGFGGYTLHLFPDGTAMVQNSCDICPATLVGQGTWAIQKMRVNVKWKKWRFENTRAADLFLQEHGDCTELGLYLVFQGKRVKDVLLVSHEFESAKKIEHFFVRWEAYTDWAKIRDALKASKG